MFWSVVIPAYSLHLFSPSPIGDITNITHECNIPSYKTSSQYSIVMTMPYSMTQNMLSNGEFGLFVVHYIVMATHKGCHNFTVRTKVPSEERYLCKIHHRVHRPGLFPTNQNHRGLLLAGKPWTKTARFWRIVFRWSCNETRRLHCHRKLFVADAVNKCVYAFVHPWSSQVVEESGFYVLH